MYLVPFTRGSPSWQCVSLPGCISAQPKRVSTTLQLYRRNRHPPPCGPPGSRAPCRRETIQPSLAHHSTAQHSTAQHRQHSTAQHSTHKLTPTDAYFYSILLTQRWRISQTGLFFHPCPNSFQQSFCVHIVACTHGQIRIATADKRVTIIFMSNASICTISFIDICRTDLFCLLHLFLSGLLRLIPHNYAANKMISCIKRL